MECDELKKKFSCATLKLIAMVCIYHGLYFSSLLQLCKVNRREEKIKVNKIAHVHIL